MPDPDGGEPAREERSGGLLHRVVRSVIAPDVLEDAGHDAPLSARGRILFYAVVGALVVGIAVLLLITALSR